MHLAPASLDQLRQSQTGSWALVEADVGSVAQQIQEIASDRGVVLELHVSEKTGIFVVKQIIGDEEQLVTTAQECDQRLVDSVRKATSPQYDLAAELDQVEREKDAAFESKRSDKLGDAGERLAHALLKDLNVVGRKPL
jgi:rubrerythrin